MRFSEPRTQFYILILVVVILVGIGLFFDFDEAAWVEYFRQVPLPLAGIFFTVAYVGLTFAIWFAKDLLRIVGALVFGPYWSTLFIWIGELANAFIFFHMSRRLGRAYVAEKFHLKEADLARAGRRGGVWHIFLLRSLPILPFRILDLAYGLTSVTFRKYLLVSALALPVRIFWVQFVVAALGGAVFNIPKVMTYFEQNAMALWLSFLYLFLSALAVLVLRKRI